MKDDTSQSIVHNQIVSITEQFTFEPVVENESKLKPAEIFVVCGMGGSHLASGLMQIYDPFLDIYIHRDYGLPQISEKRFNESLFIASSYSGNTEEVLDFFEKVFASKYNLAVIATGGKLIDFAKKNGLPYIIMPSMDLQPRNALGLSFISLARLLLGADSLPDIYKLGLTLDPIRFREEGNKLAEVLQNTVPVIYASRQNQALAYAWKIKFNETAKISAFFNVLPELNHNEMTGFDVIESTSGLSKNFHFIFLRDSNDHPKVVNRFEVLQKLYEARGFLVTVVDLNDGPAFAKIFNTLALADWTALALSKIYGTEPEVVPMIEEFKKLIS